MKRFLKLSFILLLITTFGCSGDSANCTTPPPSFVFEFIDKNSDENLFANGAFDAKQPITVIDLDTNKIIQNETLNKDNLYCLIINSIGWQTAVYNYSINIKGKSVFELHVSAERVSEDHCNFSRIKSIEIKNAEFKLDKTTGIYKILFTEYLNKKELP